MKIKFQNNGISLISLENKAKYWKVCVKWAFANFLQISNEYVLYGLDLQSKPKMYGILAQWAQYNKFVESRSKN